MFAFAALLVLTALALLRAVTDAPRSAKIGALLAVPVLIALAVLVAISEFG